MNFTTKLNPSTKCREVFSVDEATGASTKIAVIPAGVDPVYADLIETACSVAMRLQPTAPHVPLAALPDLLRLARATERLDEASHLLRLNRTSEAYDILTEYVADSCTAHLDMSRMVVDLRRAVLDNLKGVHAPK